MTDAERAAGGAAPAPAESEAEPAGAAGTSGAETDRQRDRDWDRDRAALLAALAREPWRHGFLQTLRRLDALQPDRPRIGTSARAADAPVRLGQHPSLRFAPAELAALEPARGARPPRLLVYFFGLLGPNGPLPLHLTEYARERLRQYADPTFARFLDVFHHRMLALLYRAWVQAEPAPSFDRPAEDRFGTYVAHLSGNGMPAFQHRDAMPDLAKRHYAGHLSCPTRHADGLRSMLHGLTGLPVRIDEFIGHWLWLPEDCRLRLGADPETGTLGRTATVGARVWDHQSKLRVRIGPVRLADYLRLLPGGDLLAGVRAVVRNYLGDAPDWDLAPVLAAAEVPPLRLGAGARLGWTTWVTSRPLGRDGDDLKLDPNRGAGH